MSDTELWQAWREHGDAEAFTTLVERYLDMVYATARRILGNPHDAEDVAQDCFIALLKGQVKVRHPLGPWLHRVARNRALDRIKSETRRRNRERAWREGVPSAAKNTTDDILQHVDAAIDALPAELRGAIVGRFLEGKTNAALGQACGVGESTIRLRVNNGVAAIRETLKKQGVITTAAALGALLENNMANAAPAALRQTLTKRALATPAPGPVPRLPGPRLTAGLTAGLIALLISGYTMVSGDFRSLLERGGLSPHPQADVAMSAQPMAAAVAPAPPTATPRAATATAVAAQPALAQAAPEPDPEIPTCTVSGAVYDERGYPLPGAIVTVAARGDTYSVEDLAVLTAITNADGAYTVYGIRDDTSSWGYTTTHHPGRQPKSSGLIQLKPSQHFLVRVSASAEGHVSKGAEAINVHTGETTEHVDFTLALGMSMHGKVVWPDGSPVSGAGILNVFVRDPEYRWVRGAHDLFSTGPDGGFLLGLEKPGVVSLVVVSPDGQATIFPDVPANEAEAPVLTMQPVAALSGTLTSEDGQPLAQTRVTVSGRFGLVEKPDFARQTESSIASQICTAYIHGTYTSPDGVFTFPTLAAVPDAVLTVWAPHLEDKGTSQRLLTHHVGPLRGGEMTTLDILLPGAGEMMAIAATVVGEHTGEPLPNTSVYLQRAGEEMGYTLSAAFKPPYYPVECRLSQPGNYTVWPYYNNRPNEGTRALYGQELPWEPGAKKSITFRIPEPFTLSAQVIDPDGNPIPGASVAYISDSSEVQQGKSNEEGRFEWNGFAPGGPGYMRASKEGYTTNEFPATIGEPGATYPEQTIVLFPTGGLEGRVLYPDGTPFANATVGLQFKALKESWLRYREVTSTLSTSVETGADGSYVWLDGVPAVPGDFIIYVNDGPRVGFRCAPVSVELVSGAVLQLEPVILNSIEEVNKAKPATMPR